jgi:hypothetical protein
MDGMPTGSSPIATVALTALIIGSGSGVYAQFGPSLFTVSSEFFNREGARDENVRRIRVAEVMGTAVLMLMSWGGSVVTRSPIPLFGGAAYAALSVAGYEWAIRHPSITPSN